MRSSFPKRRADDSGTSIRVTWPHEEIDPVEVVQIKFKCQCLCRLQDPLSLKLPVGSRRGETAPAVVSVLKKSDVFAIAKLLIYSRKSD